MREGGLNSRGDNATNRFSRLICLFIQRMVALTSFWASR